MASKYKWVPLADFRGGRNAAEDPLSLGDTQVVEARNGDFYRARMFRKRGGATAPSIGSAFTGVISSLIAHQPSNSPANAELWGVDDAATPVVARMAGASTFSTVTLKDNVAASAGNRVRGASYNGKLFLAYDSAVDRLHVWDPALATPSVRRVGLATPAAPTVADQGSGSYAAVERFYRVRYRVKSGSTVVAQSEPSSSTAFTPSGSGASARVTMPAAISESETHWVIEASTDDAVFYELADQAVGSTTYDDSAATTTYADNDASATVGSYTAPVSVRYLIAAFNRLLMIGNWEGSLQSRLYFTPAKGTSDRADDERIPDTTNTRNTLDLDEGVGGDATGFAGPIYGAVYLFKYRGIIKLIPTGSPSPVFNRIDVSSTRGAIDQEMIAVGEDREGRPAIYFLDPKVGPMIVGATPPVAIGAGVADLWDDVNLEATTRTGLVLDYPDKDQVWFWWATGSNNEPNILAIYDKLNGGWTVCDAGGRVRLARAAALFARTPGASMSRDLVPYTSDQGFNNRLLRADTSDTDDNGTTFQTIVKTKAFAWNEGKRFRATTPWLLARAASGVTLTVTADIDFGLETRSGTVDLTPTASETRVFRRVEGLDLGQATFIQFQIGDAAAIANTWQIERLYVPVAQEDTEP